MSSLFTEQDWLKWIDTGLICSDKLVKIAEKITKGILLEPRELSIYQFHGEEIELILKSIKQQ